MENFAREFMTKLDGKIPNEIMRIVLNELEMFCSKFEIHRIESEDRIMGIAEKLANAKKTNWISEGLSESEVKTIVELAKISAQIERCRLEMDMTQKEFAEYMGVTQGMVSKWEGREYNFTVKALNDICQKLHLELSITI